MSDIVARLRKGMYQGFSGGLMDEAADEIERLRKTAITTMREMLRRANEIERLQAKIERWQAQSIAQYAEIKRLRADAKDNDHAI